MFFFALFRVSVQLVYPLLFRTLLVGTSVLFFIMT